MITNLLNSIAKAWIKAEQARKEGKPEEIVNYIIRDVINLDEFNTYKDNIDFVCEGECN